MLWSTGTMLLKTPTRPSAAATPEIARSNGTPAAARAPKATTRITSVIGSESVSALRRSSSKAFDTALSALASPNSSTRRSGIFGLNPSIAASTGVTLSSMTVVVAQQVEGHERRAAVRGELSGYRPRAATGCSGRS